ncbi:phage protease [Corynebacterium hylobatis]|nr:phage protease [Corynebacterium hylobatis]
MSFLTRGRNQRVSLAAGPTFIPEQYATLLDVLGLDPAATADEVVAAVTALAEKAAETPESTGSDPAAVAASAPTSVVIDAETWEDIKVAARLGVTAQTQEKRLAAEQVVDQAISLGRLSASAREDMIRKYNLDPDGAVAQLSRMKAIPRVEAGHALDGNNNQPTGWVR